MIDKSVRQHGNGKWEMMKLLSLCTLLTVQLTLKYIQVPRAIFFVYINLEQMGSIQSTNRVAYSDSEIKTVDMVKPHCHLEVHPHTTIPHVEEDALPLPGLPACRQMWLVPISEAVRQPYLLLFKGLQQCYERTVQMHYSCLSYV